MNERRDSLEIWLALLGGLLAIVVAIGGMLALRAGSPGSGLGRLVADALPQTRVENPVTAVLLDFRGYDTLLEVGVLLIAWLAATLGSKDRGVCSSVEEADRSGVSVNRVLARVLLAPLLLLAAYLLWRGTDGAGGAFQAGAGAAGAAVAWRLGRGAGVALAIGRTRWLAPAGLGAFLLAGVGVSVVTGTFLDYPRAASREVIIAIELVVAGSVAYILTALVEHVLDAPGSGG